MPQGVGYTDEQIAAANREVARRRAMGQDTNLHDVLAGMAGGGSSQPAIVTKGGEFDADAKQRQLLQEILFGIGLDRAQSGGLTDDSLLRLRAAGIEHNPYGFARELVPQAQQAAMTALGGPGVSAGKFPTLNPAVMEAIANRGQPAMSREHVLAVQNAIRGQ